MADSDDGRVQNEGQSQENVQLALFVEQIETEIEDRQLAQFMDGLLLCDVEKDKKLADSASCFKSEGKQQMLETLNKAELPAGEKVDLGMQVMRESRCNATIIWEELAEEDSCLLDMTGVCDETLKASQPLHSQTPNS